MRDSLHNFRRSSLAEQAAEVLTEAIVSGRISDPLPGEVQLSEELKISRPTLRRAILILARKGLVVTAKGKRTRIVTHKARRSNNVPSVCFIVSVPRHSTATILSPLLDEVKFALTAEDVAWDSVYESQLNGPRPEPRLKEIVASRRGACFVLLNSSPALQQWFAQSGEAVLIMGSCHEGVDLPSIDLDYRAVGWHAAGQLVKCGHTNILLLEPPGRMAGVSATEAAVREYMANVPGTRIDVLQISSGNVLAAFGRHVRGPNAPTAVLACRAELALSVLGAAQQFGKPIPREFSLLARDDHPVFDVIAPQITRYACNLHAMARKTLRLIHSLLQGAPPRSKTTLVFPTFFAGQTLRSLTL